MFGLWFLASAIGGVLAGLLGGDATVEGLSNTTPVFEFMVQYYIWIGIALILVGVLFAFWDEWIKLIERVKALEKQK